LKRTAGRRKKKKSGRRRIWWLVFALLIGLAFYYRQEVNDFIASFLPSDDDKQSKVDDGKVWGIDISHHQGKINWDKLAKNKKPHFVFIKATEGTSHRDKRYKENLKAARKNKIPAGTYHFFTYRKGGKAQAEHFLKTADIKPGDLPPVLDVEYLRKMPERKKVTKEILIWLEIVEKKLGYKPIIYCDYDYYLEYLKGHLKGTYKLWICDYRNEPTCKWTFWQKTDRKRFLGIKGNVDYNLFKGSEEELKKLLVK
jgi:lysozyme